MNKIWQTPIYNRTLEDVAYANANRASPEPLKGARNYTDLNRISGNIAFVRDTLTSLGYTIPAMQSRDDWIKTDFPKESDIANLKADVAAIRATGIVSPQTPLTPDLPYTHYQKINDIEKIIFDIEAALRRAEKISYNAGAFYAYSAAGWRFGRSNITLPTLPNPPVINTNVLPDGEVNTRYDYTLDIFNNSLAGLEISVADGSLPPGLVLDEIGNISGVPLLAGEYQIAIKAQNFMGEDEKDYFIIITIFPTPFNAGGFYAISGTGWHFGRAETVALPEYPVIITDKLPNGMVGDEYSYQIEFISTSLLGVVFEIIDGELPQGLTLSDEGVISGRPLTTSDSAFTIRVTNITGYDTKDFNILIETYNTNLRAGSPFAHSGLKFYFGG